MLLVLIATIWASDQSADTATARNTVWWSDALRLSSLSKIDQRLREPFSEPPAVVVNGRPRSIRNCADVTEVRRHRFHVEPDDDITWGRFESETVHCFALVALKSARPARRSHIPWFRMSVAGVARLPLGLTLAFSPDDLEDLASAIENCKPYGGYKFYPMAIQMKGDEAVIQTRNWTGTIALYARGDLDGDGTEDLMLLRRAQANEGSRADSTLFIVTQKPRDQCARISRILPQPMRRAR